MRHEPARRAEAGAAGWSAPAGQTGVGLFDRAGLRTGRIPLEAPEFGATLLFRADECRTAAYRRRLRLLPAHPRTRSGPPEKTNAPEGIPPARAQSRRQCTRAHSEPQGTRPPETNNAYVSGFSPGVADTRPVTVHCVGEIGSARLRPDVLRSRHRCGRRRNHHRHYSGPAAGKRVPADRAAGGVLRRDVLVALPLPGGEQHDVDLDLPPLAGEAGGRCFSAEGGRAGDATTGVATCVAPAPSRCIRPAGKSKR